MSGIGDMDPEAVVSRFRAALQGSQVLQDLRERRRLTDAQIERFELGCWKNCLVFPVRGEDGEILGFKIHKGPHLKPDGTLAGPGEGVPAQLYPSFHLGVDPLWLGAGEPDIWRLAVAGVQALTGTAGEGTWLKKWTERLKGRDVVLAYDNDEAGRKGKAKVLKVLRGVVRRLRVVEWPKELREEFDISDWLNSGRSLEELPLREVEVGEFQQDDKPAQNKKVMPPPKFREGEGTAYGRAALEGEVEKIRHSLPGNQEVTLNAVAFNLGTLVGADALEYQDALTAIVEAGGQMVNAEGKPPWTAEQVRNKAEHGLADGMRHPRVVPLFQEEAKADPPDEEDGEKKKKESPAAEIVGLVLQNAEPFHDETNIPHVRIRVKDHWENRRCESEIFSLYVRRLVFEANGRPASSEAMSQAMGVIMGKALFEGKQYQMHLRTAWHEGALYYDLSDPLWRALCITSKGWTICSEPPIRFTRYQHQAAQVEPVAGGDINRLFEFVSVVDPGARLLLKVWVITCFIPGFPHPIPVLHGPQGSGKSSLFRTVRKLTDPSVVEVLTFPRDMTELVQKLSHHWCAFFDNVTSLSMWQSDALCRAATGEGLTKRALFTNDEDHIYKYKRCIGLNGINIVATRADLLDRAILIGLERIAPQNRKTEEEMEAAFVEARPQILGGIFDVLVKAIRLKPSVILAEHPRMADFARWGCAIAQAMGYKDEEFMDAYNGNLQQQNLEVLEGHPVAAAVMELMEDRDVWADEPAVLLKALEDVAVRKRITTKDRRWPTRAHVLTRRLNEVKTNLQEAGIFIEVSHSGRRQIAIRKIASEASKASGALESKGLQLDDALTLFDGASSSVQESSSGSALNNQNLDAMDAMDASSPTQPGGENLRHVEI